MNPSIECILQFIVDLGWPHSQLWKKPIFSFTSRYFQPNQHCGCFEWKHIYLWKNAIILNPFLAPKGFVQHGHLCFYHFQFRSSGSCTRQNQWTYLLWKHTSANFFECFFGTGDQKFAAKFCILDVFCHLVLLGNFIQSVWKSLEFSRFLTNIIHEPFYVSIFQTTPFGKSLKNLNTFEVEVIKNVNNLKLLWINKLKFGILASKLSFRARIQVCGDRWKNWKRMLQPKSISICSQQQLRSFRGEKIPRTGSECEKRNWTSSGWK